MKTIIIFIKFSIFSAIFALAVLFGSSLYRLEVQRQSLKKDSDGIHRECRSQLEGKITGKPCSLCIAKWNEIKNPISLHKAIILYAEKKYGKKANEFNKEELDSVLSMLGFK